MQSFGHKCSFCHNLNHASNQKRIFTKSCQFGSQTNIISSENNNMQSFGHKCSFRDILNYASNQKTSFTKVVQFGSLIKEMSSEVYNMQLFGHTFIWSKPNPYFQPKSC
jgi:hypothetical protein